jgi:hypothetical protein
MKEIELIKNSIAGVNLMNIKVFSLGAYLYSNRNIDEIDRVISGRLFSKVVSLDSFEATSDSIDILIIESINNGDINRYLLLVLETFELWESDSILKSYNIDEECARFWIENSGLPAKIQYSNNYKSS